MGSRFVGFRLVRPGRNGAMRAVQRRTAGAEARAEAVRAVLGAWCRIGAGEAVGRADERDQAGEHAAEQRQEDDRLVHVGQPFMRLTSSTAIEPRVR